VGISFGRVEHTIDIKFIQRVLGPIMFVLTIQFMSSIDRPGHPK
jgi:hypothetical protein